MTPHGWWYCHSSRAPKPEYSAVLTATTQKAGGIDVAIGMIEGNSSVVVVTVGVCPKVFAFPPG